MSTTESLCNPHHKKESEDKRVKPSGKKYEYFLYIMEGGCAKLYLSLSSSGINGTIAETIISSLSLPVCSPNNMHVDEDNEVVVICCKTDVDDVAMFRWRRLEEEEGTSLTSREE